MNDEGSLDKVFYHSLVVFKELLIRIWSNKLQKLAYQINIALGLKHIICQTKLVYGWYVPMVFLEKLYENIY